MVCGFAGQVEHAMWYILDVSVEGGMLGLFQQNSPVMKKGVEGILNVRSGGSEGAEMAS